MDAPNGTSPHIAPAADDAESRGQLGEIFVELGFITRAQLDAALAEQAHTGARLGEILVEHGHLTRPDLATALAEHWKPHTYPVNGDSDDVFHGVSLSEPVEPWRPEHRGPADEPAADPGSNDDGGDRLAAVVDVERSIAGLRGSLESHAAAGAADGVAVGERLVGAESSIAELAERLDELTDIVAGLRTDLTSVAERRPTADPEEVSALRVEAASLAGRFDELLGLRHADGHAARAATERLEVRLTALAGRQADEAESVRDARAATRADDGLTSELEGLGDELTELGRRLDLQSAIGDEQARAIEIALLEGLAALGESLIAAAGKQAKPGKHAKPGKGLRRSIEHLGAAIASAEARVEERNLVTTEAGCVAFAPTESGYRLVELAERPEVGATIELGGDDSPLVVTRYGRSPLPFDARPCAFLGRG